MSLAALLGIWILFTPILHPVGLGLPRSAGLCLAVLGDLQPPPHHLLRGAAAFRLEVPIFQSSSRHPLAQGTFYPLVEGFFSLVFTVLTVGLAP